MPASLDLVVVTAVSKMGQPRVKGSTVKWMWSSYLSLDPISLYKLKARMRKYMHNTPHRLQPNIRETHATPARTFLALRCEALL